ncbi:MAG: NYN domain-containing protein [Candidatus Diapherotrites archaeon]|nr:NYN domain-containing protein [Candidatus Diapherotrites archaeon]
MLKKIVFVDGSNLYHSMRDDNIDPRIIDLAKFFEKISGEKDPTVRYYTAPRKREEDAEKYVQQQRFFTELKNRNPNLTIIFGRLQKNKEADPKARSLVVKALGFCENCAQKIPKLFSTLRIDKPHREKGVDVKIALDLAIMAGTNEFDLAILLSGDADLAPAVQIAVKNGKKVINGRFKNSSSSELRNICTSNFLITEEILKDCVRKH